MDSPTPPSAPSEAIHLDLASLGSEEGSGIDEFTFAEVERATGAPTVGGNRLTLQFEGSNTFDAWISAIDGAKKFVYFENYVVRDDRVGRTFREALIAKARQGVPVFVIHDWLGCWATPRRFWKPMIQAGVQVRAFNPPSLAVGDPFGVLQRDHRKLVVADGSVAFVGGFCVGEEWAGTPTMPPWRDTGVEIRGPAALAAALAFERLWGQIGEGTHLAATLRPPPAQGKTPVWMIEGEPGRARVYRTLHMAAVRARRLIWITDAYFVAPRSISQALASAAQQGVDVRILVPANNNWPWVGSLSRSGYRFLLENGVRIFEWQGPMIHAKTAVVDGLWCRVGSSNMNAASLMGNWELDVGVLDPDLAGQLEGLFLADLASSVEIILPGRMRESPFRDEPRTGPGKMESLDPEASLPARLEHQFRTLRSPRTSSGGRLGIAPIVRAGRILGDALAGNRQLGREDRTVLGTLAVMVLALAVFSAIFPEFVGWTVAAVAGWFGLVTGIRAAVQSARARAEERMDRTVRYVAETNE
ncbi:MAG: phosphatidylserine/phosphatidylglycerophosphate/cardiolipin synthase family protein [Gemmatimonadota bacterium]